MIAKREDLEALIKLMHDKNVTKCELWTTDQQSLQVLKAKFTDPLNVDRVVTLYSDVYHNRSSIYKKPTVLKEERLENAIDDRGRPPRKT